MRNIYIVKLGGKTKSGESITKDVSVLTNSIAKAEYLALQKQDWWGDTKYTEVLFIFKMDKQPVIDDVELIQ